MTLDEKIAVLGAYPRAKRYKEGSFIDAKDAKGKWRVAKIVRAGDDLRVHFDGQNTLLDEWYCQMSDKVAPFRKHSRSTLVPTRFSPPHEYNATFNLDKLRFEKKQLKRIIEDGLNGLSAFDATQYFRGELFVYLDLLFSNNDYDDKSLVEVNEFIEIVIQLIVVWMQKCVRLLPLVSKFELINY